MMKTKQMVLVAMLTALSTVLMLFELPNPLVPFLKIDFSDTIVLLTFAIFGLKSGLVVAVLRLVLFGLIQGNIDGSAFPYVGVFGALMASLSLLLGYVLFQRITANKVLVSLGMITTLTVVMTTLNYFLITPLYFGWPTVSLAEVQTAFASFVSFDTGGFFEESQGYLLANLFAYVPFNILKGVLITGLFYTLLPRVKALV